MSGACALDAQITGVPSVPPSMPFSSPFSLHCSCPHQGPIPEHTSPDWARAQAGVSRVISLLRALEGREVKGLGGETLGSCPAVALSLLKEQQQKKEKRGLVGAPT